MLQPQPQWKWIIDRSSQRLALLLTGKRCLVTQVKSRKLAAGRVAERDFSVEDSQHYIQVSEALEQQPLALNEHELVWIAVNAVAIKAFHKPVALKSWYFAINAEQSGLVSRAPFVASLQNYFNRKAVIVITADNTSALCMLLHQPMQLNEDLSLPPLGLVRVMRDRLFPAQFELDCNEKLA